MLRGTLKDKKIELFSKSDFQNIFDLTNAAAATTLKRYKKHGYIKNPKRNLYFFSDNPPSSLELAYKMYAPSYISFETALSIYGIIPEVVYSIISATSKATREITFESVTYKYQKIKTSAFAGYSKKGNYFIADPEKSLVDYLYFVAIEGKILNERLNLSNLSRQKIFNYSRLFQNRALDILIKKLYAKH